MERENPPDAEQRRVVVVTDVVCPYCNAAVGQPCKTHTGNLVPFNHDSRRKALKMRVFEDFTYEAKR